MLFYVNTLASKTSKKKLAAGAVPLFRGAPGLLIPEEEKSVTFGYISTIKSEVR